MDCPIKVMIAQINYNPAYVSGRRDLLVEPFGDESTALSKLSPSHSQHLIEGLRSRYIQWLRTKISAITKRAVDLSCDVLIFPEYSIPPELLTTISELISSTGVVVVAGTHLVTSHHISTYQELGLPIDITNIGYAICPILNPLGQHSIVFKYGRSQWESELLTPKTREEKWIRIDYSDTKFINLGVFICIDGLTSPFYGDSVDNPLIAIPSWSPKTQPFDAAGLLARYNEFPLAYANTSFIGGSKLYASFPKADQPWFTSTDGTIEVPKNSEGLVTVTVDVANFRISKATTKEHVPAIVNDVAPLFYSCQTNHNSVQKLLDRLSSAFDQRMVEEIMLSSQDQLTKMKIQEIQQLNRVGTLTADELRRLCSYVEVNEFTYSDLQAEAINRTLGHLTQIFTTYPTDPDIISNIATLSSFRAESKPQNVSVNALDAKPFYDRDELNHIRAFFDNNNFRLMVVQGIRGIGKTFTVEQIPSRVLPPSTPWKRFDIKFTAGFGFHMFIDEIAFQLGVPWRFEQVKGDDISYIRQLCRDLLQAFDSYVAAYMVVDDFQYVLDNEGNYVDQRFKIFLDQLLQRSSYIRNKVIIMTNRNLEISYEHPDSVKPVTFRGLSDETIRGIVDYYYRHFTGRTRGIDVPQQLVRLLYGNPLAAITAAQNLQHHSVERLLENGDIYRRFQEGLIFKLLDEVALESDELEVANFIACAKDGLSSGALYKWRSSAIVTVESLCSRFMIEYNPENDSYTMHPLLRDYFYMQLSFESRIDHHKLLAEFCDEQLKTIHNGGDRIPPILIGELMYHYASSMQRDKLNEMETAYYDELRPVADRLMKERKFEDALDYYLMLVELGHAKRVDVIFKICLCYGNLRQWSNAQHYFEMATQLNRNAAYMWADYAALMATMSRDFSEAEGLALQAEEVYLRANRQRLWEFAKIKYALGRIRERQQSKDCIGFYTEAVDLDPTNVYYKFRLAKSLMAHGYDASEVISSGLNINPRYQPLLGLKNGSIKDDTNEDQYSVSNENLEFSQS